MNTLLEKIKKIIPRSIFKKLQPYYHFTLSYLAALYYRFPSRKLIVIGVTGTSGKTTTVYLIAQTLKNLGFKVGFTSTSLISDGVIESLNDRKMTMLGRFATQRMLALMVKNGCQFAIIETSSQGIVQFRHRFIDYDKLVFTCLFPEHIEAHGGFENYKKAKEELFLFLSKTKNKCINQKMIVQNKVSGLQKINCEAIKKTFVINGNSEHANDFLKFPAQEKIIFLNPKENHYKLINEVNKIFHYSEIAQTAGGLNFKIENKKFEANLLGRFNASNIMATFSVLSSFNFSFEQIQKSFSNIQAVPGIMELVISPDKDQSHFTVLVDYAFLPIALEKTYEVINTMRFKKIIHVLGAAGGGRDVWRRSVLGHIAAVNADFIVVTNEDPYDDDPEEIINEVANGALESGFELGRNLFKTLDRRTAIRQALFLAEKGDLVLVTGKGCEQAICVAGGKMIEWDDRKVIREEFLKLRIKNDGNFNSPP